MLQIRGKITDLTQSGAVVAVKLWVPREVKTDLEPITTLAEIDTAIAITRIQEGVATSLGLQPIEKVKIITPTKPNVEAHAYRLRVIFTEGNIVFETQAVEVPYMLRRNVRIKCLIGRDILQYCVLNYNGPASTFSLEFMGYDHAG